jgi:HEPN domain-containing protein
MNRLIKFLKVNNQKIFFVLILFVILSLIVLHGRFDDSFKVDNTTVLFIIILVLLPYFHLIRKIKFGDFEAEITPDEVSAIEKMADEIPEKKDEKMKTEIMGYLNELAEYDPNLALAKARIEIEKKIKALANVYLKSPPRFPGLKSLMAELRKNGIINQALEALLNDIIVVANRAIHGEDVSKENAAKLVSVASKVIQELDYVVNEQVFKNETVEAIQEKEVEDYMKSYYILKTIIPYVKNPEMRTYKINQAELNAFLEGYDEYAEFIVGLEKEK